MQLRKLPCLFDLSAKIFTREVIPLYPKEKTGIKKKQWRKITFSQTQTDRLTEKVQTGRMTERKIEWKIANKTDRVKTNQDNIWSYELINRERIDTCCTKTYKQAVT